MHAYELFQNVKPSIVTDMFTWMRETDRNLYKTALGSLASSRKLRLPFLQKKPLAEQFAWMHKTLQLKPSDTIAEHLLQVYFMRGQENMLVTFCDSLGIAHNGKGQVEGSLPETLDPDKLKTAVDALLEQCEAPLVTLYLRTFNLQIPGGWPALADALENDERLQLS
jgi:hypothetical protein